MDIKEYIASGIIESYVLGFSSDQERREVECLSSIYPELKEELVRSQIALEKYAASIAVTPPVELKNSILNAIKSVPQESVMKVVKSEVEQKISTSETKVIPMNKRAKLAIAASIVVILGMTSLFILQKGTNSKLQKDLTALQIEKTNNESALNERLASLEAAVKDNNQLKDFILHERTEELVLAGTDLSPQSKVRVYWNDLVTEAVIVSDFLPTPEEGKQYQLWAIIDGAPVDLGVLDKTATTSNQIKVSSKSVQAFAITLEKDGGSESPTLDQMYVVGALNS